MGQNPQNTMTTVLTIENYMWIDSIERKRFKQITVRGAHHSQMVSHSNHVSFDELSTAWWAIQIETSLKFTFNSYGWIHEKIWFLF